MVVGITRMLAASVVVVVLAGVGPAYSEGWSLPNPFASETKSGSKTKKNISKTVSKTTKREPSIFEKIGTSTKTFFNKTGEAIGLKKPETKKPLYANPTPRTVPSKKAEPKSWFPAPFASEEPNKPKTVEQWMSENKRLDP